MQTESEIWNFAVTLDRDYLLSKIGMLLSHSREDDILEDFVQPGVHIFAFLVPHQKVNVGDVRTGSQQFLDEEYPQQSSAARDEKIGICEESLNGGQVSIAASWDFGF